MTRAKWSTVLRYIVLIIFLTGILLPFYWMCITSFKPNADLAEYPPSLAPKTWTLTHYSTAFSQLGFGVYLRNSIIISLTSTLLVLVFSSTAGFALARLPVKRKSTTLIALLIISMFPPIAIVCPLYMLLRTVGWLNTYQGLIIPYTAFNMPFAIWILRNYFLKVPKALLESSRIDGATIFQSFYRIFIPLTQPGLFTAAVFTFVATWTEFFMAMTFNQSDTMRTIPVGIALFGGQFTVPYGTIFAGSIVSILPIAVLTIVFRKSIVAGLTSGALKG